MAGNTRIKIGDPDETISGAHDYTIVYRVSAAMNGFPDHDELYWNAIGTEWSAPIIRARGARSNAPARDRRYRVFPGPDGSALGMRASESEKGNVARFVQPDLGPYEGHDGRGGVAEGSVDEHDADPDGTLEPPAGVQPDPGRRGTRPPRSS